MHSLLRHILLGENRCDFTCTVIAEIEENHSIAFLYGCERLACRIREDYRLDELIGNALVV